MEEKKEQIDKGRRKALGWIIGTTAGVLVSKYIVSPLAKKVLGLDEAEKETQENKPINFYVSLDPNTRYTRESFDLARQYLQERVGLNVNFVYDKAPELNHLNRFALVETENKDLALQQFNEVTSIELTDEEVEADIEKRIKRLKEQGAITPGDVENTEYDVQPMEEFEEQLRKELIEHYQHVEGQADPKNSMVYLLPLDKENIVRDFGKQEYQKYAASLIVHEIGHLAGLWHSFQYANDKIEDQINGKTNVMSYEMPGEGRFGFDMTPEQIQQMQDYFKGGKTYQRLQRHDFDFKEFTDEIARERGYK